jgi:transcriptional regulator with XRE-family HTH domain
MACSWLRVRREAIEGLTQDALAEALGVEKRVIGSLERCEVRAPKCPDYARLAEELNVSVHELAEAHAHDLAMAGQQERADHARKVAADAWRRQGFNNIDVRKLQQALAACTPAPATTDAPPARSLIQRIADRPAGLPADAAAQAGHIADLLAQDRMDDLFNLTQIPLREAIAAATDDRLLDALRGFLTAVAQQCAAEDKRSRYPCTNPPGSHLLNRPASISTAMSAASRPATGARRSKQGIRRP